MIIAAGGGKKDRDGHSLFEFSSTLYDAHLMSSKSVATQRNVAKSVDSILASKEGSVREIWNQQIYQHLYYMSGEVISVFITQGTIL